MADNRDPRQVELEAITRLIGNQIAGEMNDASTGPPLGFMFMVFDFGEGGFLSYISNAKREDVIKTLEEFIAREKNR